VRVEIQNLAELSPVQVQRWKHLQGLTPEFRTPLLSPEFALLVAKHRPDAKVAIGYVDDTAVAFFAFHPASSGYVRAIGAPFCDYQAIVSDPACTISGPDFLSKAEILSISFTSLQDPHGLFDSCAFETIEAYRIECNTSGAVSLEALRGANPKWAKNLRRLGNKMERELGTIGFVGHDTNQDSFDALMAIKVAQYYESGMTNVLRPQWVRDFMQELFDLRSGEFGGCFMSLYAGNKFVAGQFGVRLGDWFHPWIASTCPLSHAYSPGIIFLSELIRHCDQFNLRTIDLSQGHGHYKGQFCRSPIAVFVGAIGTKPKAAQASAADPFSMISRRWDLIAAVEPSILGRMGAVGTALAAIPRRINARRKHDAPT
jgi:CelD/BcsL family acetyltransferase involved in cellulose biosynthesis